MGYSLSGVVFGGMLEGCKIDTNDDWSPQFFSRKQAIGIAEIAEHILPKTDIPGAKDIFVDRFIDSFIANCFTTAQKKEFIDGLEAFQRFANSVGGANFEACSQDEKDEILRHQEALPNTPARSVWGRSVSEAGEVPFYRKLKGLCLFGYFSSETIGKNVLNYDPVPGKFLGCVPLAEIGNAWTL